jgi:hypothetical protein
MQIKNTLLKADTLLSTRSARLYRRAARYSLRFFLLHLLWCGFMGIVSANFALAAQSAPAHASPVLLGRLDSVAPALPHGRPRTVETQQVPQVAHLGMVSRRLHPMHPCTLSILEQKFSTNLLHITALERMLAGPETLEYGLHRVDEHVCLHILGLGAKLKRPGHAEQIVELARRVGVDGERTIRRLRVHGYQLGPSAANDSYEGGCRQSEEGVGCDGGRNCAQVFLAVLRHVSICSWSRSLYSLRRRSAG